MSTQMILQQRELPGKLLTAVRGFMYQQKWMTQAVKFVLVGLLNTLVDAAFYVVLTRWLGLGNRQALAKAISYGAGVINSYAWNRTWTFKSDAKIASTLAPFVLTGLAGAVISSAGMHFALQTLGLSEVIAFMLATAATYVWNFAITKFVVFRK